MRFTSLVVLLERLLTIFLAKGVPDLQAIIENGALGIIDFSKKVIPYHTTSLNYICKKCKGFLNFKYYV